MRVHELAKELGVTSKELLEALAQMGAEGKSASSSVPDDLVPRLRASGGKATAATAKSREVLEPPPQPRKPRAKPKPPANTVVREAPAPTPPAEPPAPAPAAAVAPTKTQARREREPKPEPPTPSGPVLHVVHGATPQVLAEKLGKSPAEVVKVLFLAGEMVTATTSLSDEAIKLVADQFGYAADIVALEDELKFEEDQDDEEAGELVPRAPVVTIMGHVDHGKTKLLDAIRSTDVVAGEFGGITQHIGAYQAHAGEREITFIDTPGHEAFTAMRARGAGVTDIVVLVIAADDGVMPQTVEALDHARAAGVPIIVAVNKVDKDDADPNRVRTQMVERGIVPSEWGGDNEFVDVSAKSNLNLDSLLDTILVVADLEELTGDPSGRARGTVLEAHLDKGRGPVSTVLVRKGTLAVGDALIAGTAYCRIRAMQDENGRAVDRAGPSKPVQILGWSHVPSAGDEFREVEDEREARHIAEEREAKARQAELVTTRRATLQDLLRRSETADVVDLNLIVKADVQGSVQALEDSLLKLPQDEVKVNIVRGGAGGITENDVTLALASDAIIVGFNVRPSAGARELAEKEGVDIRTYRVIYDAIDDIKAALSGLLKPEERERILGDAEVRQTFRVPKLGVVAGSYIRSGVIRRNAKARLVRDGVIVYDGRVGSLRRFKDDVAEVREGFECGIGLENYQDMKEGDVIEAYEVEEVARSL
ncbi:MAG TPA: translation initiation factor IF-2 [Actinomycetota bacterium]|nr:translation initiation factor IF-2 [Actinomycetota bacterium]